MKKINYLNIVLTAMITILATSSGIALAEDWIGPTGTAPDNNVAAPVNTSDFSQVKTGGAGFGALLVNGQSILRENVGIGTTAPGAKLEINNSGLGLYLNQSTANDIYMRYHVPGVRWWTVGPKSNGDFWFSNTSDLSGGVAMEISSGGNVGIGTKVPAQKLHVLGSGIFNNGGDYTNIQLGQQSNDRILVDNHSSKNYGGGMWFRVANSDNSGYIDSLMLAENGNVGVGVKDPDSKLEVGGIIKSQTASGYMTMGSNNASFAHFYTNRPGFYMSKPLHVNGGFFYYSDERLKENFSDLNNSLDNLEKIKGLKYTYKEKGLSDETSGLQNGLQIGVIAQDLEKIYPELVSTGEDGIKAVDYPKLTPILIEAIKDLRKEKDGEILELKNKNKNLFERLEKLEKIILEK